MNDARSAARQRALLGAACAASLIAIAVFVLGMALAIVVYPGGSWTSPNAAGFSLLRNFWCDLLRSQAIGGAPNAPGKSWAVLAFAAFGAGFVPYWWAAASLFPRARRARVARLGAASAIGLALMAALPSDQHPIAHGVVALAGGASGMTAAALSWRLRLPGEPRLGARRIALALTLLFAASNAVLYVYVAYLGGAENLAQPVAQKLATVALIAWMLSTLRAAWHGVAQSAPDPT